jgi:uncharacterized protein YndB with AHSA1/START domain
MPSAKSRAIELPIFIHASPDAVFRAITEPAQLTRWLLDRATLSARKGGRYSFSWEDGPTHTGRVLEFVPDEELTLSWQWPGHEKLGVTTLRLSLEAEEGGTVLRFAHTGFGAGEAWTDLYDGAIRGWTYLQMNLKSVLEVGHDLRSPLDW